MRDLVRLRTAREIRGVLVTAQAVVGVCCHALVGSGLVEANRTGHLSRLTAHVAASASGRCASPPQRAR